MGDDPLTELEKNIKRFRQYEAELKAKEEALKKQEDELFARRIQLERDEKELSYQKEQKEPTEAELRTRLEFLEQIIKQKEEEIRQKGEELERRRIELEGRAKLALQEELKTEKALTGTQRLDDLLMGGIPFGANVLAMGPAFIGKEIAINKFLMEGVQKEIPAIVITTDVSPDEILEEMTYITPEAKEYTKNGLLHFIDAYSRSMGIQSGAGQIKYIDHPTDYSSIIEAFNELTKKLHAKSKYIRIAVRSISTLITYTDPTETYKFLQQITGKIKHHKDVAMYTIDKGMHTETDVQTLQHLMDGSIEFKTDGTKTFLSVQGLTDVQSRAWIQYTYNRKGLNIGSFAMGHIS